MDADIAIATAVIAAMTSLVVSILTLLRYKWTIKSEEKRQQIEHERRVAEKLLDLRIEKYRTAFAITELMSGRYLLSENDLESKHALVVRQKLQSWHQDEAAFILSDDAQSEFEEFLKTLSKSYNDNKEGALSSKNRLEIWEAKNTFRKALKDDLRKFRLY